MSVRAGDKLVLRMATPHGGELMVWAPNGEMLMVIWDRPVAGSLVPGSAFKTMDHLELAVSQITGKVHGSAPPQPVFTDTGTYLFRVGVIRTGGSIDGGCNIHYIG